MPEHNNSLTLGHKFENSQHQHNTYVIADTDIASLGALNDNARTKDIYHVTVKMEKHVLDECCLPDAFASVDIMITFKITDLARVQSPLPECQAMRLDCSKQ